MEKINGIRIVDKVIPGKKNIFRIEIWVNKKIDDKTLKELTEYMKQFGDERIEVKRIVVN